MSSPPHSADPDLRAGARRALIDRLAVVVEMVARGAHGLDVGARVSVGLLHIDFEHGFVDVART